MVVRREVQDPVDENDISIFAYAYMWYFWRKREAVAVDQGSEGIGYRGRGLAA